MTSMRHTAVLTALLLLPLAGSAQTSVGLSIPEMDGSLGIRLGDEAHSALRPLDALQAFRGVLDAEPERYDALWRAAREAVTLGMLAADDDDAPRWYAEAVRHARNAIRVNPGATEGHQWLAVALGRAALHEGPRTKVRLSEEIRTEALRALEIDSLNAAAHHVLGEWHAEIRRLSGVTRWAARRLLGAEMFDEASWEEAERRLRRSIELDPGGLIHHLALGRVLLDRDREEEARAHLREVLERPTKEPTDPLHKQEALRLLEGG